MNKTLTFAGEQFEASACGALFWPKHKTLFIADLHFEKASHFATKGYPLPPYDTLATLENLGRAMDQFAPEHVVALGDSWHDVRGPDRLAEEDQALLSNLTQRVQFVWISGNHDPQPTRFGGHVPMLEIGNITCVHEATAHAATPTLCGHYHPKIRMRLGNRSGGRALPCFAVYANVLVLPAFGAFTGGLDVTHPALQDPLGQPHTVYACGKNRVYALPLAPQAA